MTVKNVQEERRKAFSKLGFASTTDVEEEDRQARLDRKEVLRARGEARTAAMRAAGLI